MAKKEQPLPCRGLGWTDAQWADYVRSGHKSDPNPPVTRGDVTKAAKRR